MNDYFHNPKRERGILTRRHSRSLAYASGWDFRGRRLVSMLLVIVMSMIWTSPVAHASAGGTIIKALARYLTKEAGETASEQAVKQMTRQVGEELIERTASKIVREGGEKSLVEVGELVAKHGPDVIRALDNAADPLPLIRLLGELPPDQVASAASRLAAGSAGKELATLSTRLGTSVLKAEVKHPGVGLSFARSLGTEGADLSLRLTRDQAIQIGRHVDDIAKLPPNQRSQVLEMISGNADRFAKFVGRFVEQNPGKVLFTSATTGIILAEAPRILGGDGEIVVGQDGVPVFVPEPGLLDRMADRSKDVIEKPIAQTVSTLNWLLLAGGALVLAIAGTVAASKLKILWTADRATEKLTNHPDESTNSPSQPDA